jgi:hypothetical protein
MHSSWRTTIVLDRCFIQTEFFTAVMSQPSPCALCGQDFSAGAVKAPSLPLVSKSNSLLNAFLAFNYCDRVQSSGTCWAQQRPKAPRPCKRGNLKGYDDGEVVVEMARVAE